LAINIAMREGSRIEAAHQDRGSALTDLPGTDVNADQPDVVSELAVTAEPTTISTAPTVVR